MQILFCLALAMLQAHATGLTAEHKQRAERLISVFENESIAPQYDYVEDLGDGRGFTAGKVGFCTACGDLFMVVERYEELHHGNALTRFLPALKKLAAAESAAHTGLKGFTAAWKASARDVAFRQAQDEVSDRLYYVPAMAHVENLGLNLELSKAALYEAIIQHGDDDDLDGLPALIATATRAAGGAPRDGVSEAVWLEAFLRARQADLQNAHDPETRAAWRESVGRARVMLEIFAQGNFDFAGPLRVNPYGDSFTVP